MCMLCSGSSGCGGEWRFGPATPELPGLCRGADEERRQGSGYFLEEERTGAGTERELIPGAAGGELRWGQLHLPQQRRIAPQSHCGPDSRR